MRVIGIDGCRKGWIGIVAGGGGVEALFSPRVADLVAAAGDVAAVAIDIPIGLPDRSVRQADRAARERLGRLASSVFLTPVRAALAAEPYREATAVAVRLTGSGISQQAYRLREKIFEVEDWLPGSPAPGLGGPSGDLLRRGERCAAGLLQAHLGGRPGAPADPGPSRPGPGWAAAARGPARGPR